MEEETKMNFTYQFKNPTSRMKTSLIWGDVTYDFGSVLDN